MYLVWVKTLRVCWWAAGGQVVAGIGPSQGLPGLLEPLGGSFKAIVKGQEARLLIPSGPLGGVQGPHTYLCSPSYLP